MKLFGESEEYFRQIVHWAHQVDGEGVAMGIMLGEWTLYCENREELNVVRQNHGKLMQCFVV